MSEQDCERTYYGCLTINVNDPATQDIFSKEDWSEILKDGVEKLPLSETRILNNHITTISTWLAGTKCCRGSHFESGAHRSAHIQQHQGCSLILKDDLYLYFKDTLLVFINNTTSTTSTISLLWSLEPGAPQRCFASRLLLNYLEIFPIA